MTFLNEPENIVCAQLNGFKYFLCRFNNLIYYQPLDYIFFFFFFHHTTCESTRDSLTSSAVNQGDNTVSVAQGGTSTTGATKQLLPPDRVFKRNIYLYIHKIN